jgi:hypothetical protein
MSPPAAVFLWRKVGRPGHDSCRLFELARGWRLEGVAVFAEARRACQLHYELTADRAFRTKSARVAGFVGKTRVEVRIEALRAGGWSVDGEHRPSLDECVDVDLGFTPATNLIVLRRLGLRVGEQADAPAAYLAFPSLRFSALPQHYKRLSRTKYAYASPSHGYRATLRVSSLGAVVDYPGLFRSEAVR